MARGYFPLPAFNPGPGLNFEPVNNALADYTNTRFKREQLDQQNRNALMEQSRWDVQNTRAEQTHRNALMDREWQVPLEKEYKQAQITKMQREPVGGEAPSSVREWQHFQGLPPDQQQQYLTMKRANQYLDVGDSFIRPNPVNPTSPPVATVPKNLAAAEEQKAIGKGNAEIKINQPKVTAALNNLDRQTTLVNQDIDRAIKATNRMTTGIGGVVLSHIPGTPGYDLYQTLQTIKANIGFDKLQAMRENSPTGGALGQVSNFENELLQSVEGALQQGQSIEQFLANLERVKQLRQSVLDERKDAYRRTYTKTMGEPLPTDTPDYKNLYGLE